MSETEGGDESWFDAFQASVEQFDEENDDLEAQLWGDAGFHSYFAASHDPTRGVGTAIHIAIAELFEEVSVDAEFVEHRYGEVTPVTVRKAVLDQIDEITHLSRELRESIGDQVEERVARNMEAER
ncbi:hypothetical protein [Halolamina sp.]|uniref:hypothetical protein n=1 Tax=Halolamina sp. TaxID=1940283 RepID=UPI003565C6A0